MTDEHPPQARSVRQSSDNSPSPVQIPAERASDFLIVAIGASAGGLEASTSLLEALPAETGMAFIYVQHFDPSHKSLMVDLLGEHTTMTVCEAAEGMRIERDHFYIIPPGASLAVGGGILHLSEPLARHGVRLSVDFLFESMAEIYGSRSGCIILSGTGTDGTAGIKAIKKAGGFVIVQDPKEAGYDGMPKSAIATGMVDQILSTEEMPDALLGYRDERAPLASSAETKPTAPDQAGLSEIIALLGEKTRLDFTAYKPGTLMRRIGRRMVMAEIDGGNMPRYLDLLRTDAAEPELLAKDLLIHVTSFFRDPKVFNRLEETIIPDLVQKQPSDTALRIWIAGCSTGEEAYSLAILFHEAIAAANRNLKLQLFASDVDPDAIAFAREGLYPATIAENVSPQRLARYFSHDKTGYRIIPDLRACVVFTVQDVLGDPPFSRIDLISCRNLLIYLAPEAQARVISLFHFALRSGGTLLLGSAETPGNIVGRFEVISKPERLYRQIGRSRPGDLGFSINASGNGRAPGGPDQDRLPLPPAALAEFCRRQVLDIYAPAAVLVNRNNECLYSLGATHRYLQVAPGYPSHDLLAMAAPRLRTKLRLALQAVSAENPHQIVSCAANERDPDAPPFRVDITHNISDGTELMLLCFVDEPRRSPRGDIPETHPDASRVADLEQELTATRNELQAVIHNLDSQNEEQNAIHEEALSVNEEFQSTNEELLTSKEELQSLNEELTALNGQLQETLDRQRTTSDDLQNILYSTDVATLFLDVNLNIRFFTPATRSLFHILPGDIGRPLSDLRSLAADDALLHDARAVITDFQPVEREIETVSGVWFIRRISPYRTHDGGIEGVVVTFTDITERKNIAKALEAAMQEARRANVAKSRFLAAASHDLRQPLQSLALLQGLLANEVHGEKAQRLVVRVDQTLGAISGMLNTLLDINQIEAGVVKPTFVTFPINDLLNRIREESTYTAQAKNITLRVVPCGLSITSDPRLLEQMLRNLVSNALKYTQTGSVLVGCRRRGGLLSIEIWDSGIGIAEDEVGAIFDEYHQVDNDARERNRGLGLGLSIVQRLSHLLAHKIRVCSKLGKGSVFAIDIAAPYRRSAIVPVTTVRLPVVTAAQAIHQTASILVVEDDPDICELLELLLSSDHHKVTIASDSITALGMLADGTIMPDLIVADFNLPHGMTGLQLAAAIREQFRKPIPVIILTGDISTSTLSDIAAQNCVQLNKPVKLQILRETIQKLLVPVAALEVPRLVPHARSDGAVIFVIDDDLHIRENIRDLLEADGHAVEAFDSAESFLAAYHPGREACLLVDAYLPGMDGIDLLTQLRESGDQLPAIMITGNSDVAMAVDAMKAGAADFIEKPIGHAQLLECVHRALAQSRDAGVLIAWRENAASQLAGLTSRQTEIMHMVLAGHPSKNIAADLNISQRTVENHRAAIMRKTGAHSIPELARLALAATARSSPEPTTS